MSPPAVPVAITLGSFIMVPTFLLLVIAVVLRVLFLLSFVVPVSVALRAFLWTVLAVVIETAFRPPFLVAAVVPFVIVAIPRWPSPVAVGLVFRTVPSIVFKAATWQAVLVATVIFALITVPRTLVLIALWFPFVRASPCILWYKTRIINGHSGE